MGVFAWTAASVAVLSGGLLVSSPWVTVSVNERGADGANVFVPAPLALAHIAAPFLPENEIPLEIPLEAAEQRAIVDALGAVLDELERVEDFEIVRVESPRETVVVAKRGGLITVDVESEREQVRVRAPLDAARELLEGYDPERGTLRFRDVLRAADRLPSGRLVEVHEPDADVVISVW